MDVVSLVQGRLVIRNINDDLFLCLNTDNKFEENYASLFLRKSKESALKSLDDLINLPVERGKIINSRGIDNAPTTIEKVISLGDKQIILKTEGVAGDALASILYIKKARAKLEKVDFP